MQARMANPAMSVPGAFDALIGARNRRGKGRTPSVHDRAGPFASKPDQWLWSVRPHARRRPQEGTRE